MGSADVWRESEAGLRRDEACRRSVPSAWGVAGDENECGCMDNGAIGEQVAVVSRLQC